MPFTPHHDGLYFSAAQLAAKRASLSKHETLRAADTAMQATAADSALQTAIWGLWRWRWLEDDSAGRLGITGLSQALRHSEAQGFTAALIETLAALQAFEGLRSHPAWQDHAAELLAQLQARLADYMAHITQNPTLAHERLYLNAVQLAFSIATETEADFNAACDALRKVIDEDIHPEGYFKHIAKSKEDFADGESFRRLFHSTRALALGAEMATQAGAALWGYENRGISPLTAVTYIVYYYFFPEKWRWEAPLSAEFVHPFIEQQGGFLAMAAYRGEVRNLPALLQEVAPLCDWTGGGFVSLAYGGDPTPKPRKAWRLFG